MTAPSGRKLPAFGLLVVAAAFFVLAGCRSENSARPGKAVADGGQSMVEGPSHAADPIIEKARTPEERRALEKARDEVDAEMSEKARALDEEIERLRKENEQLKAAGAASNARPKDP